GPISPLKPNPALIGVPCILNKAAKTPKTAALQIIGSNIFGLAKTFGIDIFGDPIKCAKEVPTGLTRHPAMASPKPAATTPRLPAPDPIPDNETASAISTVVMGVVMRILNTTAINTLIKIGCKDRICETKRPINSVIYPT